MNTKTILLILLISFLLPKNVMATNSYQVKNYSDIDFLSKNILKDKKYNLIINKELLVFNKKNYTDFYPEIIKINNNEYYDFQIGRRKIGEGILISNAYYITQSLYFYDQSKKPKTSNIIKFENNKISYQKTSEKTPASINLLKYLNKNISEKNFLITNKKYLHLSKELLSSLQLSNSNLIMLKKDNEKHNFYKIFDNGLLNDQLMFEYDNYINFDNDCKNKFISTYIICESDKILIYFQNKDLNQISELLLNTNDDFTIKENKIRLRFITEHEDFHTFQEFNKKIKLPPKLAILEISVPNKNYASYTYGLYVKLNENLYKENLKVFNKRDYQVYDHNQSKLYSQFEISGNILIDYLYGLYSNDLKFNPRYFTIYVEESKN